MEWCVTRAEGVCLHSLATDMSQPLNPYSCLTSAHSTLITTIADSASANRQQLVYSVHLGPDQHVFTERPFVQDTLIEIAPWLHQPLYNKRQAWNLVERCFKTLVPAQIEALLATGYATGVVVRAQSWETPADDHALQHIMRVCRIIDEDMVRRLYDIMATNNIVACTSIIPSMVPPMLVPARYGFFLLMSRMNHACIPSARLDIPTVPWGDVGDATSVLTTRAVRAGEPLTFDYVNAVPLAEKRKTLLELFGFRCECDRCRPLCALLECNNEGSRSCPCHAVRYCSQEHQRADWLRHKASEHIKPALLDD